MGRTLPSATMIFDGEAARWSAFRRALRREDQAVFDEIFLAARRHLAAIAHATSPAPMEAVLLAMLLEQRRQLEGMRWRLRALEQPAEPVPVLPMTG